MKTIGLLGGMSWESTLNYYKAINEGIRQIMGGLHSAKIVMYSVDFDEIEKMQRDEDWDGAARLLSSAARNIQSAGADFLLLCTNTMHKVAPEIQAAIQIPLIHIADTTGEFLAKEGIKKIGLLGTTYTMEQDFYRGRLAERFDLEVLIPEPVERKIVHRIIYEELCLGETKISSRAEYFRIMNQLVAQGAEGVILGCTEIGMLVTQSDTRIRLFDTTALHIAQAVRAATKA